jgi:hypothetical protein
MKTLTKKALIIAILAALTACGGDDTNGGDDTSTTTTTGIFLDSVVQGLSYSTDTQNGLTGEDGSFSYLPGEDITFSVGQMEIGTIPASDIITNFDLGDTSTNPAIAQLLQSLDVNLNPDDGRIDLTHIDPANTSGIVFDGLVTQTLIDDLTASTGDYPLVDAETALAHANVSRYNAAIESGGVLNVHAELTDEEIANSDDRVKVKIGYTGDDIDLTSMASDIKLLDVSTAASARARLSITGIYNGTQVLSIGFGIKYSNEILVTNGYVELYDPDTGALVDYLQPTYFDATFKPQLNQSYKFELKLEQDQFLVGYIDGAKIVEWDITPLLSGTSVITHITLETRMDGSTGDFAMAEYDNLRVEYFDENSQPAVSSDDFNDDLLYNPDYNFIRRTTQPL